MKDSNNDNTYILDLSNIKKSEHQNKGKSSSETIKKDNITYQLKGSANDDKGFLRRQFWDTNNADLISEFIGTTIARALMPKKEDGAEIVPEVKLAIKDKKIKLVSKYLNCDKNNFEGISVDDLYKKLPKIKSNNPTKTKKSNRPIVSTQESPNNYNYIKTDKEIGGYFFDQKSELKNEQQKITLNKKDICKALIVSALVGDHDVNPGNIYVVYNKDTKNSHVGRIDFGHAFNDLIRSINNNSHTKTGFMLDFINGKVNGLSRYGIKKESKFRRDHKGFALDEDFAKALREFSDDKHKESFISELNKSINALSIFADNNNGMSPKIKSSIQTIYKRLKSEDMPKNLDLKTSLGCLNGGIQNFIVNNMSEAVSIANLIDVQNLVKKYSEQKDGSEKENTIQIIKDLYNKDQKYLLHKSIKDPISWVKNDDGNPSKPCSLVDYVSQTLGKENAKNFMKDFEKTESTKSMIKTNQANQKSPFNDRIIDQAKEIGENVYNLTSIEQNSINIQSNGSNKTDSIQKNKQR